MQFKLILSTATAIGLLAFAGAANAGGNEIYLDQNGVDGIVDSVQSGDNNTVGTPTGVARARQVGTDNHLVIRQSGDNNVASSQNRGIDQLGSDNYMYLDQSGNGNEIVGASQFGKDDDMRIYQQSNGNTVEAAVQDTQGTPATSPSNFMQIVQKGSSGNDVVLASQDGNGNDMRLTQDGARNSINKALQGEFNSSDTAPGYPPNTYNATMNISQTGNDNVVDIADQDGTGNSLVLTVNGNGNGANAFTSSVAIGVSNDSTIGQASMYQANSDNIMNASLSGNDNAFSFAQTGLGDMLVGTVVGNRNEMATNQFGGHDNSINFQIAGSDNELGLSQTGQNNAINSSQSGNSNVASLNQGGSGNLSTISQY